MATSLFSSAFLSIFNRNRLIVDITLTNPSDQFRILYSNKIQPQLPSPVKRLRSGTVAVQEIDGTTGSGPLNCVQITLAPLEAQILAL